MSAEKIAPQEVSMEVRYRYQDALRAAFKASYLDFLGWNTETFTDRVITPALFPEYFPPIERSNVIELWERESKKTEPIDAYQPELDYAFGCMGKNETISALTVYEVRTFLGWAAIGPDAQILDFPHERLQPATEFPVNHNALIIYPFGS